jgi:hypothetical protein
MMTRWQPIHTRYTSYELKPRDMLLGARPLCGSMTSESSSPAMDDEDFDVDMAEFITADAVALVKGAAGGQLGPRSTALLTEIAKLAGVALPKAPKEDAGTVSGTQCVACGRSDRKMTMRKSGLKCDPWCVGQPSSKKETVIEEMKFVKHTVNDKGQEVINDLVLEQKLGRGALAT